MWGFRIEGEEIRGSKRNRKVGGFVAENQIMGFQQWRIRWE